jgi:hypothetical protein
MSSSKRTYREIQAVSHRDRSHNSFKLLIFSSCVMFILHGCLCTVPSPQSNSTHAIVKEYDLPDKQWRRWNEIKEYWMKNEYLPCLKRFKLRMSCSHCEYISIKVELKIDGEGSLVGYKKIGENICGKKAGKKLEECLLKYFKTLVFPEELRNITIEASLGTGLKC